MRIKKSIKEFFNHKLIKELICIKLILIFCSLRQTPQLKIYILIGQRGTKLKIIITRNLRFLGILGSPIWLTILGYLMCRTLPALWGRYYLSLLDETLEGKTTKSNCKKKDLNSSTIME
jgi:hypothetical protein|tara:strand:+ start:76 stop:432 length:357 start_codon:yes stop_codon:yes gene_type:complete